ncbi:hypothetical protein ELH80_13785 [Rhizobium ruizarguesonis]|uniref:TniB family NTP-binding protein n=1 Tax=Rhizobium ruizarguesonis TaxID=2081791 RepID=UPI001031DB30|nr:TniB family NTP-binding protein [Rhizobium ruizarguesonis]TAZ35366.1 hypothetical protein ELH80_13785 [Rhizobium ruizarguesonis]
MTGRLSQAEIVVKFKEWVIPHSRAERAMRVLEELREQKRLARWDTEARAAYLLAPSQSGKTHTVSRNYFENFVVPQFRAASGFGHDVSDEDAKKLQKLVLYVKIPARPHLGAFAAALLDALGDPRPWRGAPYERLHRALTQMREAGVELIIFDNFDHLSKSHTKDLEGEASRIQDILKEMIENGWPIVFVGLPSAKRSILRQIQIGHRMDEIYFGPFKSPEQEFVEYLSCLDLLMINDGIMDESSNFENPHIYRRLLISSAGQLGVLSNTVRYATKLASAEKAAHVAVRHLAQAVNDYAMRLKICKYNPFDVGEPALKRGLAEHAENILKWEREQEEAYA